MKFILKSVLLFLFMIIPFNVFAIGDITVSTDKIILEVGEKKTFTISAYNTIGDVTIESNNSSIADVNPSEWETGTIEDGKTITGEITVTGNSVGTASIKITLDAATFDSEELTGEVRTINVNIVEKTEKNNDNNDDENEKLINNSEKDKINDDLKKIDISKKDVPSAGKNNNYIIGLIIIIVGIIASLIIIKVSKKINSKR